MRELENQRKGRRISLRIELLKITKIRRRRRRRRRRRKRRRKRRSKGDLKNR